MAFKGAVLACLVGNLFLALIAILLGLVALHTGLSTSFLSRQALGARASSIFSFILALSAVNWIAVNADTFSHMIQSTFSWWPVPVGLTAILVVALWAQSAIRGMKGLEFVSWLGVPCALVLTIASVIAVGMKVGYGNMPPPIMIVSALSSRLLMTAILSETLAPPSTATKGRLGLFSAPPMGQFDPVTQRRVKNVKSALLLPAAEVLPSHAEGGAAGLAAQLAGLADKLEKKQKNERLTASLREDAERLRSGAEVGGMSDAFEAAAKSLEENKWSGIVESDEGFYIILRKPLDMAVSK